MLTNKNIISDNAYDQSYHLLRAAINKYGRNPGDLSSTEFQDVKQQAEKSFALEQMILSAPESQSVVLTESLIEKSVKEIKARYSNEDDFIADLNKNGLNDKKLHAALYRELLVETVLDKIGSRAVAVSELDVMIYYYLHKEKFTRPETRESYHILITLNDDFAENTREAAMAKLTEIRKRLLKKPERFSEQALKHSECPSALRDGYLGNLPKGQLYPELESVMFSLKQGEISGIVESPLGLHLLYCKKISKAGVVSMKDAEAKILEHLQKKRSRMCQKNWLSELAKK